MKYRTFTRAASATCLIALLMTLGVHWILLQSVAWVGMVAEYSRSASVREALRETFDGQHPCRLCLQIRDGREQQKREQAKIPWLQTVRVPDWFFEPRAVFAPIISTAAAEAVPFVPKARSDFIESPPTPPPRPPALT